MNNIDDMQKSFEGQKFKVFSPFKCDISKNEDGNYVDDTTIFAFAWFCRGIASQAQQPCTTCGGSGYSPPSTDSFLCQACSGKGYPPAPEGDKK